MSKTSVKTKAYEHNGREGRSILLTDNNIEAVNEWLGDASSLSWIQTKIFKKPKIKVTTRPSE